MKTLEFRKVILIRFLFHDFSLFFFFLIFLFIGSFFSLFFFFCFFPIFVFNFFKACPGDSHRNVENDSSNTRNVHYIHITRKSPDPERAVRCMIHCLQYFCPWRLQDYSIIFCKTIFHIYILKIVIYLSILAHIKKIVFRISYLFRARARAFFETFMESKTQIRIGSP